jgi:Domain of unknown function (DUF1877)
MGIRQSFARITAQQFARLQSEPTSDVADAILTEQYQRGEDVFSPLDDTPSFDDVYTLTLEKSYWELLDRIVKMPVDEDPFPVWPITEGGATIGDFWMGYSPLYVLTPQEVHAFAETARSISRERLAHRFQIEFRQYDNMDEEEKEGVFEGMMACFDDLAQLVHHAAAADEAIVWYIS